MQGVKRMQFNHVGWLSVLLLLPVTALADVTFTPSVTLGSKTITFGAGDGNEVDVDMPTQGLGIAATFGRITAQVNVEQSISDGDYSETSDPVLISQLTDADTSAVANEVYQGDVSRDDISFTLSYAVLDQLSLFVGYLDNTTKLDNLSVQFFDGVGDELGLTDPFGSFYTIGGSLELNDSGAMTGVRYVPLATGFGSLSTTLGYAVLKTETDFVLTEESVNLSNRIETPTTRDDTTGVSASVSWVGLIPGVDGLRYLASLRLNRFTQDDADGDINNDLTYAGAGLMYSL